MRRKTRTKIKKGFIIAGIVIGIILIIIGIYLIIKLHNRPEVSYDDGLVCKNYFTKMTIDLDTKEVKRDDIQTSLAEEFDISEEQENFCFSSKEEMNNFLSDSVFELSVDNQIFTIKNPYQTKRLIVKADEVKEKIEGEEIEQISDGLYVLSFYSEKLTKAMYKYYKGQDYIKELFYDEIYIDEPINDISQTMYGETEIELGDYHSLGATVMGLDNYIDIINENGNPKDIVIATIGYGIDYQNEFFKDRIDRNAYNFILENKDISETIPQGSRIAEILVDSTTSNVRIMPLVTVTEEGYTSMSSIVKAVSYATKNSDVICYELINNKFEGIDKVLENAFKENIPVCCVSTNDNDNYPANHGMTIAISSIDRDNNISDYSGQGDYIDFTAPSTDIEEIFNKNSTVSRWSGPQYSNAQIVSAIALIKTYDKEATILDVYNFLRNFTVDLGKNGKDDFYGYGCPVFRELKISDIDNTPPEFKKINYDNENWEPLKQVEISARDNIRINQWAVTKNENEPNEDEWEVLRDVTHKLDVTKDITENGVYYIWVKDTAGNTATEKITVEKVDNTPPQVAYVIDKETLSSGYVTINVTAEDSEAGLSEEPFSWDKQAWSLEQSTKIVKENGRYIVYARDKLENIGETEILVDCFPQAGRAEVEEGNIIASIDVSADWVGNTNNNVQIKLNPEINIVGWQITTNNHTPSVFVEVHQAQTQTSSISRDRNIRVSSREISWGNVFRTTNSSSSSNVVNATNTNIEIIRNTTNTNSHQNVVNTPEQNDIPQRTEPIKITTSLDLDIQYYLWIKDRNGNTYYQMFKIFKAEI